MWWEAHGTQRCLPGGWKEKWVLPRRRAWRGAFPLNTVLLPLVISTREDWNRHSALSDTPSKTNRAIVRGKFLHRSFPKNSCLCGSWRGCVECGGKSFPCVCPGDGRYSSLRLSRRPFGPQASPLSGKAVSVPEAIFFRAAVLPDGWFKRHTKITGSGDKSETFLCCITKPNHLETLLKLLALASFAENEVGGWKLNINFSKAPSSLDFMILKCHHCLHRNKFCLSPWVRIQCSVSKTYWEPRCVCLLFKYFLSKKPWAQAFRGYVGSNWVILRTAKPPPCFLI